MIKRGRKHVLLLVGLLAGVGLGVFVSVATAGPPPQPPEATAPTTIEELARDVGLPVELLIVRTNDAGETYGSGLVVLIKGMKMPDLVMVCMDDGRDGYVYSSELESPPPANPEEAVRWMQEKRGNAGRQLVARDEQGRPIGTFTLGDR